MRISILCLRSARTDTIAEDAPAPMAIHSFKAEVKDGKIQVTANPENTTKKQMSREPKVVNAGTASATSPGVVIVGGGSAAFHAIDSLREVCELAPHRFHMEELIICVSLGTADPSQYSRRSRTHP